MFLFWRSFLMMYWIKSYYGQKIDFNGHSTCSGQEDMEFLKDELIFLRGIVNDQDKKMEMLEKELNVFKKEVAFTAELKHGTAIPNLKRNERIVFGHVIINRGNAYNNDSGIFRCPRSGLYAFFFNILTLRFEWAYVEITINGNHRYSVAYSGSVSMAINGSNFVLLRLTVGDEVWLRAGKNWTSTGEVLKHAENTFSGFLVHPY